MKTDSNNLVKHYHEDSHLELENKQRSRSLLRGPRDEFREVRDPSNPEVPTVCDWPAGRPKAIQTAPTCSSDTTLGHSEPFSWTLVPDDVASLPTGPGLEAVPPPLRLVSPAQYSSQGTGSEITLPPLLSKALKWPGASSPPPGCLNPAQRLAKQ